MCISIVFYLLLNIRLSLLIILFSIGGIIGVALDYVKIENSVLTNIYWGDFKYPILVELPEIIEHQRILISIMTD